MIKLEVTFANPLTEIVVALGPVPKAFFYAWAQPAYLTKLLLFSNSHGQRTHDVQQCLDPKILTDKTHTPNPNTECPTNMFTSSDSISPFLKPHI